MDYLRHAVNRRFVLGAAASLSAAMVSGFQKRSFAADKPLLVNSIRSLSNAYHATWNKGGEAFAKAVGCEYLTLLTEGNSEKGIADINAVLARTKGNCVINVDPNDTPDARPIIEACFSAGAHVMTQWSKPADLHPWDRNPYWVSHVTFDGLTSGRATADELIKAIGGEGGILALGGIQASTAATERKQGLDKAIAANPGVKLLDFQIGEWQSTKGFDITNAWITRFGDKIKGIWCANDDMAMGALEALRAEHLTGKVSVSGVDGIKTAVEAILAGEMVATMSPDPYWQGAMGLSIPYHARIGAFDPAKEPKIHREFYGEAKLVTKANAAEYMRTNITNPPKLDFDDLWSRAAEQVRG